MKKVLICALITVSFFLAGTGFAVDKNEGNTVQLDWRSAEQLDKLPSTPGSNIGGTRGYQLDDEEEDDNKMLERVWNFQNWYNQNCGGDLAVDGLYGPKSHSAKESVKAGGCKLDEPEPKSSTPVATAIAPKITESRVNAEIKGTIPTNPVFAGINKSSSESYCNGAVFCGLVEIDGTASLKAGGHAAAIGLDKHVFTKDEDGKDYTLPELLIGWITFLYPLIAILAVVALVYAGILYIINFGDDAAVETAKKIILWVVLGLLAIFSAFAIVHTVITGGIG